MPSTAPQAAPDASAGPHRPAELLDAPAPAERAPEASQPAVPAPRTRRGRSSVEAWQNAISANSGTQLGRIARSLAGGSISRELHALIVVLRDELDETDKRALRKQLEFARKRYWLLEHRLAIALSTLEAADEELAHQVLQDDGIPLERVLEAAAELRVARAARRDGEAA